MRWPWSRPKPRGQKLPPRIARQADDETDGWVQDAAAQRGDQDAIGEDFRRAMSKLIDEETR